MIDNAFRSILPRLTLPLIGLYRRLGLTPNAVSALGFALALVSAGCILAQRPLLALAVWWLGRLADGTDGILARATNRTSHFGAYIDIVLDMAAYTAIPLALDRVHPELHGQWIAMVGLYVLCITSALALGMQEARLEFDPRDDRGLRLGAGLAEGGETGLAYSLFLLFPEQLNGLVTIWLGILATTVLARSMLAYRRLA